MTLTINELKKWILSTVKHSSQVEYFLNQLNVGSEDPERPHDLVGPGNKLEWEVMSNFALQYLNEGRYKPNIIEARELHRQQFHHRMWNEYNPNATIDSMEVGAIDAICSLLENRRYQGGQHTYDEILKIIESNSIHKVPWFKLVIPKMKTLVQPDLTIITDLNNIPNIGMNEQLYEILKERVQDTLAMLKSKGYQIGN